MADSRRSIVVLIGSPKGLERSSSARLASKVTGILETRDWTSQAFHIHKSLQDETIEREMQAAIDRADVVLLSFPLYVDGLPGPVTLGLERIAQRQSTRDSSRGPVRFASIVNCGFVEPTHNFLAERMLRAFSEQAAFEWYGAVMLGMAGMVNKRIAEGLGHLAAAMDEDILMPESVVHLTEKAMFPRWLYILVGNHMWKKQAKEYNAAGKLKDRPYEEA